MRHYWLILIVVVLGACGLEPDMEPPTTAEVVNRVVPVVRYWQEGEGFLPVGALKGVVYPPGLDWEAQWIRHTLHDWVDYHGALIPEQAWQGDKVIALRLDTALTTSESYTINIDRTGVEVIGGDRAGLFYGLQTLAQMIDQPNSARPEPGWPALTLTDAPQFSHRGLLLDCCRHFMDVDFVKHTIDQLAFYKMNVLHWHLTEDQGWRIEIDAYPALTEHGAWRTEADGKRYGGFYTKEQIREVVAYAAHRGVEVIPEIEMPGHSSAAISAYPWLGCTGDSIEVEHEWGVFSDVYCAGNDSTLAFMRTVLDEVCALFPSPYIHIGGDEAPTSHNKTCPKCQRRMGAMGLTDEHALHGWFIAEMAKHLASKGKTIIGWDEILDGGLAEGAVVQSWRGMEGGRAAVRSGHPAIMSPTSHCYLDYPLSSTDTEEVFSFTVYPDSLDAQSRALVLGGEVNMWTERAPQEVVESKIYPRLLAMSEALWRPDTAARSFAEFRKALGAHYPMLEHRNVAYGFESVPLTLRTEPLGEGGVSVELETSNDAIELWQARLTPDGSKGDTVLLESRLFKLRNGQMFPLVLLPRFNGKPFERPFTSMVIGHLAIGAAVQLDPPASPHYTGGGNAALVDGRTTMVVPTTANFREGIWQGVSGDDFVATVDLGREEQVKNITANFLEYANAWIFFPDSVRFESSSDGVHWEPFPLEGHSDEFQGTWETRMSDEQGAILREKEGGAGLVLRQTEEPQITRNAYWRVPESDEPVVLRYLRMTASNRGECPEGHPAAGQEAWIFCDELIVQ